MNSLRRVLILCAVAAVAAAAYSRDRAQPGPDPLLSDRIHQLTDLLATSPYNSHAHLELAFEYLSIDEYTRSNQHLAIVLTNTDRYAAVEQARRPRSDQDIRSDLIQIVEFLRLEISNLGYLEINPDPSGWQIPDMGLAQQRFAEMFDRENASSPLPFEPDLGMTNRDRLRPIHNLIRTLASRHAVRSSTSLDRFIFHALTTDEESFDRILLELTGGEKAPAQ